MGAANFEAIENALQAWVTGATGIPGDRVVWAEQNGPRPARPFATLRLGNVISPGLTDEERCTVVEGGAPGADLRIETVAQQEIVITVETFTAATTGNGSALALLTRAKNALSKNSQIEAFDAAGIAVVDRGTVQNLTALLDTEFEGRASLDVRIRFVDGAEDLTTWIATAEVRSTFNG